MKKKEFTEQFEDVTPNPEHLIKSISEQGYSFEAAIADLIDNSISAGATLVEILIDKNKEPFTLYVADNGSGMNESTLKACMRFPSQSPDDGRDISDLGRFGLGLKTASFSQTRKFTVVSKDAKDANFAGRTWDLEHLKKSKWELLVNSPISINTLLNDYTTLSNTKINAFDEFIPKTIIQWRGLYKFEQYLEKQNRQEALNKEIDVIADHLSLVFHRFMEGSGKLRIRFNNRILKPFNPFPTMQKDFRSLEFKKRHFGNDVIKIEGFVLPSRAIEENRQGSSIWTTSKRSLMDMEGIYVYRANRLILFGGWNGLIRKAPRLQLARLQVEIGNNADNLLHLNVAKSQVIIPHELKNAFKGYIAGLKQEAEREYFNRGVKRFKEKKKANQLELFTRTTSSKGPILEINDNFEIVQMLVENFTAEQQSQWKAITRLINVSINKFRNTHEVQNFIDNNELNDADLVSLVSDLMQRGLNSQMIKSYLLPELGYNIESLPTDVLELLKGN